MEWQLQDRWMLLATVSLGAILMYLFDTFTGSHRRAWLREHLLSALHRGRDALASAWGEARDLFAEAKILLKKSPSRKN